MSEYKTEREENERREVVAKTWPFRNPPASYHDRHKRLMELIDETGDICSESVTTALEAGGTIDVPVGTDPYTCLEYDQAESDKHQLYESSEDLIKWRVQLNVTRYLLNGWRKRPQGLIMSPESVDVTPKEIKKFRDLYFRIMEDSVHYIENFINIEKERIDEINNRY